MIALAPILEKEEIEKIFKQNNMQPNEFSGVVTAKEKRNILGFSLYELDNEKMLIKKIFPLNDIALADGILRSTLHIAAERSIMNAFYEGEELENFCEKVSFIKDKKTKKLEIDKLFRSCCNCK